MISERNVFFILVVSTISGKYFADFEIPPDLQNLWRYMYHMYTLDAFTQSCPADQDIISHYKLQHGAKMSRHEELETPSFSIDVPATANLGNGV